MRIDMSVLTGVDIDNEVRSTHSVDDMRLALTMVADSIRNGRGSSLPAMRVDVLKDIGPRPAPPRNMDMELCSSVASSVAQLRKATVKNRRFL